MPQDESDHLALNNLTTDMLTAWPENDWFMVFIRRLKQNGSPLAKQPLNCRRTLIEDDNHITVIPPRVRVDDDVVAVTQTVSSH
jgi:hypothetical protein